MNYCFFFFFLALFFDGCCHSRCMEIIVVEKQLSILFFFFFTGCQHLIQKCLTFDSSKRFTLEDIKNHNWMRESPSRSLSPAELCSERYSSVPAQLQTQAVQHPALHHIVELPGVSEDNLLATFEEAVEAVEEPEPPAELSKSCPSATSIRNGSNSCCKVLDNTCRFIVGNSASSCSVFSSSSSSGTFSLCTSSGYDTASSPPTATFILGSDD